MIVEAWKEYTQIEHYADTTKYGLGERILAPLADHTVKSEYHPSVQIPLNRHEVGSVRFNLEFSLTLEGFVLVIQDAKIMEIPDRRWKGRRIAIPRRDCASET